MQLSAKCVLAARRYKLGLCLAIPLFFAFLTYYSLRVDLPSPSRPLRIYSTQTRDDIRLVTLEAIRSATSSITLYTYALTDQSIKRLLLSKAKQGVDIQTYYDPSTTKKLPQEINPIPLKTKGLMHEKILIIDKALVILGSANMTSTSLMMHDNILLGLYNEELAKSILDDKPYPNLHRLPSKASLKTLLTYIDGATRSIDVAMFTFTHPELCDALIRAQNRGVSVRVALDSHTARAASKKVYTQLQEAGLKPRLSRGLELFHYKWAYIDQKTLILGSANWTKAAFTKNQDYFLVIDDLLCKEKILINRLIYNIITETKQ